MKQQIRRRDSLFGLLMLAALVGVMLFVLFHLYRLMEMPHLFNLSFLTVKLEGSYLIGPSIVLLLACFILVAVWFSLGSDSLLRRFAFLICFFAVSWGVWLLGCIDSKDEIVPIRVDEIEPAIASALLPALFMAIVWPLLLTRTLFGHSLVSRWEPVGKRVKIGIRDILVWTCMVAIVFGGVRLAAGLFDNVEQLAEGMLIPVAIFSGFSMLVVLPLVFLLFSKRFSFLLSSILTMGLVLAVVILITATIRWGNGRSLALDSLVQVGVSSGIGVLVFLWGALAIRLFGYRLVRLDR